MPDVGNFHIMPVKIFNNAENFVKPQSRKLEVDAGRNY